MAANVKTAVASVGDGTGHELRKQARKEALRLGRAVAKRALSSGSEAAGQMLRRSAAKGLDKVLERADRPPIQQSVDVAVPPEIAWSQWLELRHLPEGAHRLTDVERDGESLTGTIEGLRSRSWEAEIIDEREQESFAWRSIEGSDSAGLVTFHQLGERLTRLEVTLDVHPEELGEAARLMLHIADRRVAEELRLFKADAELLNPDVYEELLAGGEHDEDEDSEDGDGSSGG